jgi:acetyltransferase-like isoleucine patch superfamily enzyme
MGKIKWNKEELQNSIAEKVIIHESCSVTGSNLHFYSRLKSNVEFRESTLGEYSYISSSSVVNKTEIGKFTSIAPGCYIGLWEHNTATTTHSFYLYETSGGFCKGFKNYDKDHVITHIGNDVWVGANVTILKGIRIGDGSIIGAGSVVTKDVEPYSIVVGTPAKCIKYRFSKEDITFLIDERWWDYSRDVLTDMVGKKVWDSLDLLKQYINSSKQK